MISQLDDNRNCCYICLEENISDPVTIVECFHQFCFDCLFTWLSVKTTCPVCKISTECFIRNKTSAKSSIEKRSGQDSEVEIWRLNEEGSPGHQDLTRKRKLIHDLLEIEIPDEDAPETLQHNLLKSHLIKAIDHHRWSQRSW